MKSRLNVYGVRLEFEAVTPNGMELLRRVSEDFKYFHSEDEGMEPDLRFNIDEKVPRIRLLPAFRTKMCRVYGWGAQRVCDYGEGTVVWVSSEPHQRSFTLQVGNLDLAYEALTSALLSSLGEKLDLKRFHRVHALGIEKERCGKRERALIILPSGGGKSAIGALLAAHGEFRVLSDESPLIHDGKIYPFPIRGALKPEIAQSLGIETSGRLFPRKCFPIKMLFSFQTSQIGSQGKLDWAFLGQRSTKNGQSGFRVSVSSRWNLFLALLDVCVLGRGLAQMTEYLVRGDSLWVLPQMAVSRFYSVVQLLFGNSPARCGLFLYGDDARQNEQAIQTFFSN